MPTIPRSAYARPLILAVCALPIGCAYIHFGKTVPPIASGGVEYSWRTQSLGSFSKIRTGSAFTLVVNGLNKVCYDYDIAVNQVPAVEKTADFLALLGADPKALEALTGTPPTGTPASSGAAGGAKTATNPNALALDFDKPTQDLKRIADLSKAAFVALNTAVADLKPIVDARAEAKKALDKFYADACPGGGSRGTGNLVALWATAETKIKAFTDLVAGVDKIEKSIKDAKAQLNDATKIAVSMRASTDPNYKGFLAIADNLAELAKEESFIEKTLPEADKQLATIGTLRDDTKLLKEATAQLPNTVKDTIYKQTVTVKDNTASITGTVKATGKNGVASVKGVSLQDVFEIPVERLNRVFMTAGLMMSDIEEHHYDRINMIVNDSVTYSTFADYRGSKSMAFSPVLLAHVTAGSFSWLGSPFASTDFTLTGGLGMRTVAEKASPDFLIGGSLTFRDQIALSLAWHKGRVETLLLGAPDAVKARTIPSTVTRQAAVGYRWADALAVLFSVRLP